MSIFIDGSNFLGLGIGLAELLIAVIGLGGGTYAGARGAAINRAHLEDRRRLYIEVFPEMGHFHSGNYQELDTLVSQLWSIGKTVELLSWTERSLYRRALSEFPSVGLEKFDRLSATGSWIEEWLSPQSLQGEDLSLGFAAFKDFQRYIGLMIRPGSPSRRFERRKMQAHQLVRGPWQVP